MGKEVRVISLKFENGAQQVKALPGQSLTNRPVASLAQVLGRPKLRSVDSEPAGRVMEPRKNRIVGADGVL